MKHLIVTGCTHVKERAESLGRHVVRAAGLLRQRLHVTGRSGVLHFVAVFGK